SPYLLDCPGKFWITAGSCASTRMLASASGCPLAGQIAPVIDMFADRVFNCRQRARTPWTSTAIFSKSVMASCLSVGAKFEQDLAAAIRFQRLLERFLELLERVDKLHCGRERSISYEVAQ